MKKRILITLLSVSFLASLALTACASNNNETSLNENSSVSSENEIDGENSSENSSDADIGIIGSADGTTSIMLSDTSSETSESSVSSTNSEASQVSQTSSSAVTSNSSVNSASYTAPKTDDPYAKTPLDNSYFDDAIFIGDSISNKLKAYANKERSEGRACLGNATFLTAGSLGTHNAMWPTSRNDSVHPLVNGQKMLLEDSVAYYSGKKIYIMLGMNDFALYGIEDSINQMKIFVDSILAKSPNAKIFIQSMTPILDGFEGKKFNNENIEIYNQNLEKLCKDNGYTFIDVARVMRTEKGTLIPEYCSDNVLNDGVSQGVHFTNAGCKAWVDYLYTHY